MNRWEALFFILDINLEELKSDFCEVTLQKFEITSKIHLPSGYKDFYRAFRGGGTFGNSYINIYCPPDLEGSNEDLNFLRASMERMRDWGDLSELDCLKYETLLTSAFVFGGTCRAEHFIWDLRTYRADDDSYDIYLLRIDDPSTYLVGRDFFRFVRNFCLGTEAFSKLPEGYWIDPYDISFKFTR
jgi:hypothetical protein